jgi:hypothetical protein
MGAQVRRALREQHAGAIAHDDRHQHGRVGRLAVGEARLGPDLRLPGAAARRSGGAGNPASAVPVHQRQVRVDARSPAPRAGRSSGASTAGCRAGMLAEGSMGMAGKAKPPRARGRRRLGREREQLTARRPSACGPAFP